MPQSLRIGHGLDIHRFSEGRPFVLGGVTIPHVLGLAGHSDADALTHALIDAVLGAAGESDIGTWFSDQDAAWKDAESVGLLARVWGVLSARGWILINADCAVLAEAPLLQAHIPAMKERWASVFRCDVGQLGIKATTAEKLGFVGREEGVVASAVVLLDGAAVQRSGSSETTSRRRKGLWSLPSGE